MPVSSLHPEADILVFTRDARRRCSQPDERMDRKEEASHDPRNHIRSSSDSADDEGFSESGSRHVQMTGRSSDANQAFFFGKEQKVSREKSDDFNDWTESLFLETKEVPFLLLILCLLSTRM